MASVLARYGWNVRPFGTIFLTDGTVTPVRLARELGQRGLAALQVVPYAVLPTAGEPERFAGLGVREVAQLPSTGEREVPRAPDECARFL